jgi:rhodanese-related sulfurtransferase
MHKFAYLLAVGVLVAACGGTATVASSGIETVAPSTAEAVIESAPADLVVLDVRTPDEFASGHLSGASNIDFYASDFKAQIDALDKSATYVVYCHSGNRSGQATTIMKDLGFQTVYNVEGGINAWEQAGLPVTAG